MVQVVEIVVSLVVGFVFGTIYGAGLQRKAIAELISARTDTKDTAENILRWVQAKL